VQGNFCIRISPFFVAKKIHKTVAPNHVPQVPKTTSQSVLAPLNPQINFADKVHSVVAIISNCDDKHAHSRVKFINELIWSTPELGVKFYGECGLLGPFKGSKEVCAFFLNIVFYQCHIATRALSFFI
jgi:hypothetical protein